MRSPALRDLLLFLAFAAGYPILFEALPDHWNLLGLPFRGEAILLALAIPLGRWAMGGIVVGALTLRGLGIDNLPWTFAVVEAVTFVLAYLAARAAWDRLPDGWNALGATAAMTGGIVAVLGTYWAFEMGAAAYPELVLQAFLAINVVGTGLLLVMPDRIVRPAPRAAVSPP